MYSLRTHTPSLAPSTACVTHTLRPPPLASPAVRWNEVNTFVRKTTALMEVGTGVLLILELLTPYRNILALVMYWQFLRVRAILSPYTKVRSDGHAAPCQLLPSLLSPPHPVLCLQDAFRALDRRILSLTSHNACPALIRSFHTPPPRLPLSPTLTLVLWRAGNGYQKVRSAAAKMAETPQPGQQPAGGGGMSSCTIV